MNKSSIPHIIHYCWFGGAPLSSLSQKCIESWKKYCPDYELRRWDESNVDLESCDYIKEAYKAKKWAFVSDFVRFQVLYEYGGVYFDTDVELLKPINDIVAKGNFMGVEQTPNAFVGTNNRLVVAPGLGIGAEKNCPFYGKILGYYNNIHFINSDGSFNFTTVGEHITSLLYENGLENEDTFQTVCDINIFPKRFFNPMDANSGTLDITTDTVSIHHYAGTWVSKKTKIRDRCFNIIYRIFGARIAAFFKKLYRRVK